MTFLKVRMSHTQTHIQRNDNWLFIHLHLLCSHTNPSFDVVVLMALFSRRRDTTSRDVPSSANNWSIFLFSHCVSLSLGSLPPSQLIVHHLTTTFLHIIYCVHWFHLNSIICTNVSVFHFSWHTHLPSLYLDKGPAMWDMLATGFCNMDGIMRIKSLPPFFKHSHLIAPSNSSPQFVLNWFHCSSLQNRTQSVDAVGPARCGAAIPNKWHISFSMTGSL